MSRGLTLAKYGQSQFIEGVTQGYRLVIQASDAFNVSENVFLYQRGEIDPETGLRTDNFVAICSPVDLEEYPSLEPGETDRHFRLSGVDLLFRSPEDANDTWEDIYNDVDELIETLNMMDTLELESTTRFGDDTPSSSSSPSA